MGTSQQQALGTEKFQQNQALFRKYTAVGGASKTHIVAVVEPVFLSSLVEHMTKFVQESELTMIQHLFTNYRWTDKIYLEENALKIIRPYEPMETLARLIEKKLRGEN